MRRGCLNRVETTFAIARRRSQRLLNAQSRANMMTKPIHDGDGDGEEMAVKKLRKSNRKSEDIVKLDKTKTRRSRRSQTKTKNTKTLLSVQRLNGKVEDDNASKSQRKKTENGKGSLDRAYEEKRYGQGYEVVAGTDEAGRGPLAGPVVAAAFFCPVHVQIEGVQDSKKVTEPDRERIFEELTSHPEVKYAVEIVDAQRIDDINILQASLEAMSNAVKKLSPSPDFVYVDGNRMPRLPTDAETVVKGDSKVFSIAAASIIAKVTRDRLMLQYHEKWPMYNFAKHKGYPTREHMAMIAKHGPCPIHRMTFAPLKYMDKEN